jgi:hypothetical protein
VSKEISVAKKRGRPPGALNKKTRAMLQQALKEGITPLQVRLKNMRRWDRRAIALEIGAKALAEPSPEESSAMLERAEDFRQRALHFAVAALPFVHRQLGSIKCTADAKPTLQNRECRRIAGIAGSKDGFKYFAVIRTTFGRQVD